MRIFRRALIFSTPFAQNFSTFCQNFSGFGEKYPTFSAPLRAALATRHKKRTAPQFIVQSFVFQSKHEAAFPLTSRGARLLCCPSSHVKSLVHSFLCTVGGSSVGLVHGRFRATIHGFHTLLCGSLSLSAHCLRAVFYRFGTFLSGFRALLSSGFCLCGSAASGFRAFCTSLLALGGLFCSAFGYLLPLGAGFLCILFAARFHFFLGCIGIHLHHLRGSCGTYGENGGESQTAEQGVEIEFHCSVVLVVISIRISVSFVTTHGVIFYRRLVFPVCACKCNA